MLKKKRVFALLLICCVLTAACASANKFGYAVDAELLRNLEEQSAFPVRVTEKKIVLECFDRRMGESGADALVITVTNETDKTITGVQVGFIALNEEGLTTDVLDRYTISSLDAAPEIMTMARSELSLAPGESCMLSLRVDYDYVKGVRAMVSGYTTEDGTVTNPDYDLWQSYAFGLDSSNSTELD